MSACRISLRVVQFEGKEMEEEKSERKGVFQPVSRVVAAADLIFLNRKSRPRISPSRYEFALLEKVLRRLIAELTDLFAQGCFIALVVLLAAEARTA